MEKAGLEVVRRGGPGGLGGRRRGARMVVPRARWRLDASSGRRATRSARGAEEGGRGRVLGDRGVGGGRGARGDSPKAWSRAGEKWG